MRLSQARRVFLGLYKGSPVRLVKPTCEVPGHALSMMEPRTHQKRAPLKAPIQEIKAVQAEQSPKTL